MVRTPSYIDHLNTQQSKDLNHRAQILASNKEYFHTTYKEADPYLSEDEIEVETLMMRWLTGETLNRLMLSHFAPLTL
ncbi:hypothetical protein FOG18_02605 [Legionella israelensis]|uniref:hypothetical protein n=1 Tax=Legionella israelensis TaxID=454 RepID=UPI00117F7886|nr:hypothetical protein [Legionella israelensis]QDP71541.1 hypothetical protein FOG18_02605 [Legionella israelensis]